MYPGKSNGKLEPANSIEENNDRRSTPAHSDPIPASRSKTDSAQDHLPEMEIHFAELEDGSLAEMIEDPADPTKSLLAVYKDGNVQYAEQWQDRNRILVPLPRTGQMLKHVSLPAGSEPYVGLEELM